MNGEENKWDEEKNRSIIRKYLRNAEVKRPFFSKSQNHFIVGEIEL